VDPTDRPTVLRRTGSKASLVLERLAEDRRRSLILEDDRPWLQQITQHPTRLLSRMEQAQLLYRIGRGRYVVAPRGTFSPTQAAPLELMVDLVLRPQGDYFLSFLSGLISHRLTDLHSSTAYAAVRGSIRIRGTEIALPTGRLHLVRLTDARWPRGKAELEQVRALPDSVEKVWRATRERTLVDALARPDLSAGIETVVDSWVRAKSEQTDWDTVCEIASHQGVSMARRTAFLLRLIGLGAVVRRRFQDLPSRGVSVPFDRSSSYDLEPVGLTRDRRTGVVVNVPADHLLAWTGATSLT
jgi:predicted transcriptional regulator of viral defense system